MNLKKMLSMLLAGFICITSIPFAVAFAEETEDIAIWDGSADTFWYNDIDSEFHISTAEELAGFAKLVNDGNDFEGKTIFLENELYLNEITDTETWDSSVLDINIWIPIGNNENSFDGTFDGKGNKIFGIFTKGYDYAGLFGYASNESTVKNITLSDGYVSGTLIAGGIVGFTDELAKIDNCYNCNDIFADGTEYAYAGGITGKGGIITRSKNAGNVSSNTIGMLHSVWRADSCAGGISSGFCASISDCCNYGNIYSKCPFLNDVNSNFISMLEANSGGIAGMYYSGEIKNCHNTGMIKGEGRYAYSGGICGQSIGSVIDSCYSVGVVDFSGDDTHGCLGGIIGYQPSDSTVINSYYLNTSALKGIGNIENDTIVNPNATNMQKESFAQTLGYAFVYVEGDYPKLLWEIDYIVANFVEEYINLTEYGQQKSPELVTNYLESPTWVSSDTNVATVENGIVTAKNNGECVIYAVCEDVRAECNVTVNYGYTLSTTNIELNEDETAQLSVISDNTGLTSEDFEIEWISSDENVVTVENGTVTPVSDGTATITATFGENSLKCEVTVKALIPDPELDITSLELYEGKTEELTVNNYTGNITWISDNTEVAKVENGIVKAIAPGNANIYAMLSNGTNLICAVTVNEAEATSTVESNTTTTETTTVTTVVTTVTEEAVNPDLNSDGKINVADVLILQKFLVNIPSDVNVEIIDINNDKKINVFDLIILKRIVLYS
ncbi:MAG: Ig-like domain-containing protein [Porcipelethomonas sp.]